MELDADFDYDWKYMNMINDNQNDFPIYHHSSPLHSFSNQLMRSIDFPSMKKHYGIINFLDHQMPIIYRLINDKFYSPYIRFSYVLNIFEHSSYKDIFIDIRNLPIIEMTTIEKMYYDQLSSLNNSSTWSDYQLLSVSILDGVLSIVNFIKYFNMKNDAEFIEQNNEWQEILNKVRQQAYYQWILDEKIVLNRLREKNDMDSKCILSRNLTQRRSILEERLDLSIVDEAGGFIQIDSFIYPFIKNLSNNQIYINLNDIRQNFILPPSHLITYSNQNSSMYHNYSVIIEQVRSNYEWNTIYHGSNNDLSQVLPSRKTIEENLYEKLPFIPLQTLLHLFLNKDSNLHIQFVQLFETASFNEIKLNYKNNIARQFIMSTKRQGGLVNGRIPCLIFSKFKQRIIWIPSETKTQRVMNNDERLYLNIILLYYGLWKNILTKTKQWYLKEIDSQHKENMNIEILLANG